MASVGDQDYLRAVERGDLRTAGKMVAAAAKEFGFCVGPVFHGTRSEFTEFRQSSDPERFNIGFHFGSKVQAKYRVFGDGEDQGDGVLISAYLKGNFVEFTDLGGFEPHAVADSLLKKGWMRKSDVLSVYRATRKVETANDLRVIYERHIYPAFQKYGYTGISYENEIEGPGKSYAVFSPDQIRLATPVAYDDLGQPIPLSRRFAPGSNDIRGVLVEEMPGPPAPGQQLSNPPFTAHLR